jgi:hypothetical protein
MVLVFRDVDPEPLKYTGLYLKLKGNWDDSSEVGPFLKTQET